MEPLPFPKAMRLVEHGEVVSGALFADPLAVLRDEDGCETSFEQPIPLICIRASWRAVHFETGISRALHGSGPANPRSAP
jgi:hypothetical protein